MIKAIIFDCFGVLAEDGWLPFKRKYIGDNQRLADVITDLGKQNDYGMLGTNDYFKKASELIGVNEQALRSAVGKQVPNIELLEYIESDLKQNYKIGLLSNANYDVVTQLFTEEQSALFDATALSYETRLIKPDPRLFELIASRLGVSVDECLLIDDVERYCTEAKRIGMEAIVYEDFPKLKRALKNLLKT